MEIEYTEPKLLGTEYINVIEYEGKPYFRLQDLMYAALPGIINEHLILNSLFPSKGEICLANYIIIEWVDEDEYKITEFDEETRRYPFMVDDQIYMNKPAALALLLDKDEAYLNRIVDKIIRIYGLSEDEKLELYMLKGHLWNMSVDEYERIDRVAEFKQRAIARKRQGEDIYRLNKDNFDEVLDC